jgi:curved DNA-binding protein
MKYKDYYEIMGLERGADADAIKKAYRKLAHKYHPDVSKDKDAEERFKEVAEAYATLKDPEKRAAYDSLGRHRPGEEFRPPPDWGGFSAGTPGGGNGAGMHFEDFDLSDLFEQLGRGRGRAGNPFGGMGGAGAGGFAMPGNDFEAAVQISLEDAARGTEVSLDLAMPEPGPDGMLRRTPRKVTVRIPKGATEGQRLRVRGKGGAGIGGAPAGDLYLDIHLAPHPLFRASGHDLYIDLPLTPSEAVLGAEIELPSLEGKVRLNIKPGAVAGQKMRLTGKGLPKAGGGQGNLYAVVQITVPAQPGEREKALYAELAAATHFNPRAHFEAREAA